MFIRERSVPAVNDAAAPQAGKWRARFYVLLAFTTAQVVRRCGTSKERRPSINAVRDGAGTVYSWRRRFSSPPPYVEYSQKRHKQRAHRRRTENEEERRAQMLIPPPEQRHTHVQVCLLNAGMSANRLLPRPLLFSAMSHTECH